MIRLKVGGITSLDEARAAIEAGATLLGFHLSARGPRALSASEAAAIVTAIRAEAGAIPLTMVGRVVDEPVERVRALLAEGALDVAELHGSEPPLELAQLTPGAYKTIRPQNRGDAEAMLATFARALSDDEALPQLLVESYQPWGMAVPRKAVPLRVAAAIAARHRILLGGLSPEGAAEALAVVRPWGVDVELSGEGGDNGGNLRAWRAVLRADDAG